MGRNVIYEACWAEDVLGQILKEEAEEDKAKEEKAKEEKAKEEKAKEENVKWRKRKREGIIKIE